MSTQKDETYDLTAPFDNVMERNMRDSLTDILQTGTQQVHDNASKIIMFTIPLALRHATYKKK